MAAPAPLFEYKHLDLTPIADRAEIATKNPHRDLFALIDHIIHLNSPPTRCIGQLTVKPDDFWTKGHIPGKPIMPGVLLVEAGAQVASYLYYSKTDTDNFAGFTRIQDCAFRGMVTPGQTLTILVQEVKYSPRRFISDLQGIVEDQIVFGARISGMAFPNLGPIERKPLQLPRTQPQ